VRFLQQELSRTRTELGKVEENIKSPLVRALIKLLGYISRPKKPAAS
jgi:hypothetical protein